MPQVRISSNFKDLSRRLHTAARDLPQELANAAGKTMRTLPTKLKGSALSTLPHRGGLNRTVAFNTTFKVHRIPSGARIVGQSAYDIAALDHGQTIHPLFGDQRHWYREAVKPGWWSRVVDGLEPTARQDMEQALENVKQKIEG